MNLFRKKTKPEERRACFRNKIAGNDYEAVLRQEGGQSADVAIVDLSAGGAKLRLVSDTVASLAATEQVVLELVVGHPSRLVRISAQVCRRKDGFAYIEFLEPNLSEIPLDVESRILLSRRKFLRHRLKEHVAVELTVASVVVAGAMEDISEGGLAMSLAEDLAGQLGAGDAVEVSFLLPGSLVPCVLKAEVRNRTPRDGRLRFGLEFTPDRGDDLNPVLDFLAG